MGSGMGGGGRAGGGGLSGGGEPHWQAVSVK